MTASLTILNGKTPGKTISLHGERVVVGRMPDCDFVLQDESISRHHACIFRREQSFYVKDLDSRNGTYLNGERIREPACLSDGDQIQLYEVTLTFAERNGKINIF